MVALGEFLKEKMTEKNISVLELSKRSGVSKTCIYGLFKYSYSQPYFSTVIRLARILDLSITDFDDVRI